jgi:site-specific DNA-methyltransferase (adenine-specific)
MARKPFAGTVAANVAEHGTGAINIDACRVEPTGESRQRLGEPSADQRYTEQGGTNFAAKPGVRGGDSAGRWPANLIHDGSDLVIAMFPESQGQQGPSRDSSRSKANTYGEPSDNGKEYVPRGDTGSAARFYYCAKTSRADRHEGLIDPGPQFKQGTTLRKVQTTDTKGNNHPTVKPTELMAYLLRLVTPIGGTALDPFMGSGSTGKAAMIEGFNFIGIEQDAAYMSIATARIAHAEAKSQMQQAEQQLQEQQLSLFSA